MERRGGGGGDQTYGWCVVDCWTVADSLEYLTHTEYSFFERGSGGARRPRQNGAPRRKARVSSTKPSGGGARDTQYFCVLRRGIQVDTVRSLAPFHHSRKEGDKGEEALRASRGGRRRRLGSLAQAGIACLQTAARAQEQGE